MVVYQITNACVTQSLITHKVLANVYSGVWFVVCDR
jgi:hypothetical protein